MAVPKPATVAAPQVASTVNVDAVLATIRQQESGGNYSIVTSGGSDACGAYQYISSTWQAMFDRAMAAGALPAGTVKTARACQAPPAVQDAVARYDVTTFLNSVGGNVALVPLHWYYPAAVGNQSLLSYTPPGNNISIGAYQANWLKTYAKFANDPAAILQAGTTATSGSSAGSPLGGTSASLTSFVDNIPILGTILGGANAAQKLASAFIGLFHNWRYVVQVVVGLGIIGIAIFLGGKHLFEDRAKEVASEVGPAAAAAA